MIEIKSIEWFDDRFYKVVYFDETNKEQTRYIPSVSTKCGAVAKPFLARWRGDIGNREADLRMQEGADRGTRIHDAWYKLTNGGCVVYQPKGKPLHTKEEMDALIAEFKDNLTILRDQEEVYALTKLQRFCQLVEPSFLGSEMTVYDLEANDAGTTDNLVRIEEGSYPVNGRSPLFLKGGQYILDVKSGQFVGEDAYMQVAAYRHCVNQMGLGPVEGAIILHTQGKNKSGIEGFAAILLDEQTCEIKYVNYRHVSEIWQAQFGDLKPKVFELPSLITLRS